MTTKQSSVVDSDEALKPSNALQSNFDPENSSIEDDDERYLRALGYKQALHRQWRFFESFAASFAALYSVGGIRTTFTIGVGAGGPVAYWSSYLITCLFVAITASVLAEICSALPAAGSIYFWAAEAFGKKGGRLAGFIVAFWTCTAWTSFISANCQAAANFLLSEITVYGLDFTTDVGDVKFRAVQWIVAEIILCISLSMNYLSPNTYRWIFRAATYIILIDFFLNIIWLPIAVSRSYGFQSADYLLSQANETGAPPVWNWMLSFYVTAGILVGFEASGHISEETKNASYTASRGIFWSAMASAAIGFPLVILFLFCLPGNDIIFGEFSAPQPFVQVYALSMGDAHIFMTIVCIVGLIFNTTIAGVASSRLIWAVARDGVLPFSSWISRVGAKREPKNAIVFMHIVAALLLCTILPSPVAFTSLVSAAGVPTITSYALIAFGRTFVTPRGYFQNASWSLGKFSRAFNAIAFVWNLFLACVLFSPLYFPVTGDTFNYSPVIFFAITVMGIVSWFLVPEDRWLPNARLGKVHDIGQTLAAQGRTEVQA